MIIISLIIAVLSTIVTYVLYKKEYKLHLFYFIGSFIFCLLIGGIFYYAGTRQDFYNEIWGYKCVAVQYYEPWDEKVSCRHPIYSTRTRRVKQGKTYTTETYRVVVGHYHLYDVDWHSEYWKQVDEYNDSCTIDKDTYLKWKNIWGNSNFNDLHRNFHTKDGDMYESRFTGGFDKIYPLESVRTYENRIRVSNSVFKYAEVTQAIKDKYFRLADKNLYNGVYSYDGVPFLDNEDLIIRRVNAQFGSVNKVHVIVLLWNNTSSDVMNDVLSAWQGPNKNELIVSIGVSNTREINWCQVYSWVDDTTIHSAIRQRVNAMKKLDFINLKDILVDSIPKYWHRKDFKAFDYIENDISCWYYIFATTLMVAGCVGGSFLIKNA